MDGDGYDVVIAGAGPTGLHLAGELALAGVRCKVVERRTRRSEESRALAVQARTMEELDMRATAGGSLADAVVRRGDRTGTLHIEPGGHRVDVGLGDSAYGYMQVIAQWETERILEEHAADLGVHVERGVELTGLRQDDDGVVLDLRTGDGTRRRERTSWLVGCDGAHSAVRRALGVPFRGRALPYGILIADVHLDAPPEGMGNAFLYPGATVVVVRYDGVRHRVVVLDRGRPDRDDPVTLEEVDGALRGFGLDLRPRDPVWTSRFVIHERRARTRRMGRVLLAGDAAHVHSPLGGQGLNLGMQDAVNLGWKLAAVVDGRAGDALLDTYAGERDPIARTVIASTAAATRLMTSRSAPARAVLRTAVRALAAVPPLRRPFIARLAGTTLRYPAAAAGPRPHAMAGRRVPDLVLSDGRRLYEAMRAGTFALLDQEAGGAGGGGWAVGDAARGPVPGGPESAGAELLPPRLAPWAGLVTPLHAPRPASAGPGPDLVLIRPDGYCAWAGRYARADADLPRALRFWAGERAPVAQPS